MNYIFDKEKIRNLISDFYISTGIPIVLYDTVMNTIASSSVVSDYCQCLRKKKDCYANCNLSNIVHIKHSEKSKSTILYSCHAGMMEVIDPIFFEDTIIAYIQVGQFRDVEQAYSSEEKIKESLKKYDLYSEKMLHLYRQTPLVSQEKLQALLNLVRTIVKSFWVDGLIHSNRSMTSIKIEQYIAEHIDEKIYIKDICDTFFLSKNALYRLFNNEFNMTVNEYILQKRMNQAKKLLKETNMDITDIAFACGFSDYNYFIRMFGKINDITPLQFRKKTSNQIKSPNVTIKG